jgi:hypothetical protein
MRRQDLNYFLNILDTNPLKMIEEIVFADCPTTITVTLTAYVGNETFLADPVPSLNL